MNRQQLLSEIWNLIFEKLDGFEEMDGETSGASAQSATDAIEKILISEDLDIFTELH